MNISLKDNLKNLKLHWTGPQSDAAFKALRKIETLKCLILVVSKSTSDNLSRREHEVRKFFRPTAHKSGSTRLPEALGFDELLNLDKLDLLEVKVVHISKAQSFLRTNDDRHNLERCLQDRFLKPAPV